MAYFSIGQSTRLIMLLMAGLFLASTKQSLATEWNVSLWGKRRAATEHVEKLAELVRAKTGSAFTLNISYGGLSKARENLDGISIGAFEMAQFCAGYHADKNPSLTVLELPFLGINTLEQDAQLSKAIYAHPAVVADLARWNATLLMPTPLPQYNIVGLGNAPKSLSDFKGVRVRAVGGIGRAMKAIGAVPTSMSASEVRQAMDSGVVSAVGFPPHAHMSYGTIENAKWMTSNLDLGTANCPIVVNTDALNALGETQREALLSSVNEALNHYISNYYGVTMGAWETVLERRDIQKVAFDEKEIAALKEAVAVPAAAEWVKQNSEAGLPGQELYDLVTNTIAAIK